MSKIRKVVISDDGETVYLVDEYQSILAEMSMSWFELSRESTGKPPTEDEMKKTLLEFYSLFSGGRQEKTRNTKKLVVK